MRIFKKTLAIILSLSLVIGVIPFNSYAAETNDVATAAIEMGTKPADGTTASEPFPQGTGGSNSFRIPSLVTLSDGSLVAAADARWNTTYDGGGLDTIVSRSSDGGDNWSYTFANYLGDNGNAYNGSSSTAFIDPALAVDTNNTIYMLVDLYPYGIALNGSVDEYPSTSVGFNDDGKLLLSANNHSSYDYYLDGTVIKDSNGNTVSGYTVDEYFNITATDGTTTNLFFSDSPYKVVRTGFLYLTKSTDKGETWSTPTLIPNVKTSSEQVCLVGPGRGLVTSSGMIVFPVYSYNGSQSTQKMSFIYSTDNGATWNRSANFTGASWSSESAVVELNDGTLRFFYRNGTTNLCYVDYANNAWGTPVTMSAIDTNSNCQISAIKYSKTIDGKQVVLVSCPTGKDGTGSSESSASARLNGKIFAFTVESDGSMTKVGSVNVTSNNNQFMYSCLTELNDGTVGILYEDKENAWGAGSDCYYTMSYDEYNLATAMSLTFDTSSSDGSDSDDNTTEEDSSVTITKTVDVTLAVGETSKVYTVDTGNYEDIATITDDTVATMEVTGFDGSGNSELVEVTTNSFSADKKYLIVSTRAATNEPNYSVLTSESYTSSKANWLGTLTGLAMNGPASADSTAVWTIAPSNDGYTISKDENYLTMSNNSAAMRTTASEMTLTHTNNGWIIYSGGYYLSDLAGTTLQGAFGYSGANDSGNYWTIYEVVESTEASTEVSFTGVNPGTTTAVVGTTKYNITVIDGEAVSVAVGGNITATMDAALTEGQTIKWSVSDSKYASVASNYTSAGAVTNNATIIGNTVTAEGSPVIVTGTIYNSDGTVASSQKWIVTVTERAATNTTTKYIKLGIDRIQNCTVYYSINGGELIEITDDMLAGPYTDDNGTYYTLEVLMDEAYTGGFQISFFADPDEGYALTYMNSTNSAGDYYVLSDGNADGVGSSAWPFADDYNYDEFDALTTKPGGNDSSVFDTNVGMRWGLAEGNLTVAQLKVMYANAIAKGCDGVLVFTKNSTGTTYEDASNGNNLISDLTFVAEKLPEVYKVLSKVSYVDSEGKTVYKDYNEGMSIGIGYTLHYTIYAAIPRMQNESSINNETGEGIKYTDFTVTDELTKAEWVVKSMDSESIPDSVTWTDEDVTDTPKAVTVTDYSSADKFVNPLTDGSVTSFPVDSFSYEKDGKSITYDGSTSDILAFNTNLTLTASNFLSVVTDGSVTNVAELDYIYAGTYSIGDYAATSASIVDANVVVPEYVIDFGQPVNIDLTNDPLVEGDKIINAVAGCGDVTITGDCTFTYTPNKVLQGTDFITLTFADNGNENAIVGYGVRIYPATTVYYEETFFGEGWTQTGKPVSAKQASERLGEKLKLDDDGNIIGNNYGYDPAYNATSDSSSYISANTIGANASATFTGTGFDMYANCLANEQSASVSVRIKNEATGAYVKTFLVDTAGKDGTSNATSGQVTINNAPIVSVRDLEYGTYTVVVTKVMDSNPVQIDGFRVYNTLADSTVFSEDLEDNPDFYELRDEVLAAATITDTTSKDYGTLAEMSKQVYSVLSDEDAAVIVGPTYNKSGTTDATETTEYYTVQDLLDNGPKNELLLHAGSTLIFNVKTDRDVQVGLKAPNGETSYKITGATETSGAINTTIDMFYDMGVTPGTETEYTFTITNTGSNNLSVTLLKICDDPNATFNSLTEADIESALIAMGYGPEEPETPVEPTPGTPDEPSQEPEHECIMKEEIQPATTMKDGKIIVKCEECGEVESTKIIRKASNVKLSMKSLAYNGKQKNPKVIVKDSKGNVIDAKYYKVTKPKGRTNVGKYTYTVKFNGLYKGTKKLTLTVKPKATAIKSVTAAKKAFTVKWSKVSKQATGYEIMYATNAKFTKGKHTVKVTKLNITSKKISKLKANKKYYVKVRTYKTVKVNGKQTKIYSNWSKYRTVTTKR